MTAIRRAYSIWAVLLLTISSLLLPQISLADTGEWASLSHGLWGGVVKGLVISPNYAQDHTLFAGTELGGVYRSTSRGDNWEPVNSSLLDINISALAISPHYSTDRTLFAGTQQGRLFKSTNRGNSWVELPTSSSRPVTAIGLSPSYPNDPTIIIGHLYDNIFVTRNDGATWDHKLGMHFQWSVDKIVYSPHAQRWRDLGPQTRNALPMVGG